MKFIAENKTRVCLSSLKQDEVPMSYKKYDACTCGTNGQFTMTICLSWSRQMLLLFTVFYIYILFGFVVC